MADFDYEELQVIQTIYDAVLDAAAKSTKISPSPSVRETVAKSIFAISQYGQQDIHKIERYALARAMTALARMTA